MPRRRSPPRLYLDQKRKQWIVRDGARSVRTSCAETDRRGAEKRLAEYLASKHEPQRGDAPLIADMLLVYAKEHVPHTRMAKNVAYLLGNLLAWWGDKTLSDVTARNCRAYAETKTQPAARGDLEVLRAAINYWHREYGPLPTVPVVVLPAKAEPRDRWLTRDEAARLLWAARRTPHLARFILLGLYTGSRSSVLTKLQWSWIDFDNGVMSRRGVGTAETKKRTPKVKLGSRILTHLRRWRRLDDRCCLYVCHYNGSAVTRIDRSWRNAIKKSGLEGAVVRHTLRHTRATWLMLAGVDPWQASGHLGMNIKTLQTVYGHHHPDFQDKAANV
jgi:integrase